MPELPGADAVGLASDPLGCWWSALLGGVLPQAHETRGRGGDIDVVDLCAGLGCLTEGIVWAGAELGYSVRPTLAVDSDPAVLALLAGLGPTCQAAEVGPDVDPPDHPRPGARLMVTAGPPCQGYSTANTRRSTDDPRRGVYLDAARWAAAAGADLVLIENVPGAAGSPAAVEARRALADSGLETAEVVIDARAVGWCQRRRRHFLFGRRGAPPGGWEALSAPERPVSWALARSRTGHPTMDAAPVPGPLTAQRIDWLHDSGLYSCTELPEELRWPSYGGGWRITTGRLHPDEPSPTIITRYADSFAGRGRFGHPTERRLITLGEGAAIQGIPPARWRHLQHGVGRGRISVWAANACPPPLAMAAAWCLLA